MSVRGRALILAARVGLALVSRLPVPEAVRGYPPPSLPGGWLQMVLVDLVAVDIERWRRFTGELSRTDEIDGATWCLQLSQVGFRDGPSGIESWWRRGLNGTVPELCGTLTISSPAGAEDGAAEEAVPFVFEAAVELVRTRTGRADATLRLVNGWRNPTIYPVVSAPAAPREPHGARADGPWPVVGDGWTGFPPPIDADRSVTELDAVRGGNIYLTDLFDLFFEPDELLLTVDAPAANTGSHRQLLVRITADGPIEDTSPEYLGAHDTRWNEANAIDLDYRIDELSLEGDELRLGGREWLQVLRGERLRVQVEILD